MIPIEDVIRASTGVDPKSLAAMATRAQEYLLSHAWCLSIRKGYLDLGWPGILSVFWFEIEPAREGVDSTLWVIVGDLPSATICNDNPDGKSALEVYTEEMQRWVDAVRAGEPVDELIPVNTPPTEEYADMLASRLKFIRERLLPDYDEFDLQLD